MAFPTFSEFPVIPNRSAPEAEFDAKMYALFIHFATTHRDELLAFISFLQNNSTIIGGALNATTLGLDTPAAGRFTSLEAESLSGLAVVQNNADVAAGRVLNVGWMGLGADTCPQITDFTVALRPGFYRYLEASAIGAPGTGAAWQGSALVLRSHTDGRSIVYATRHNSVNPITWIGVRGTETGSFTWIEIAKFDASGNFGIGTTSPLALFHAEQTATGTVAYLNGANAAFSGNQLTLDMDRAGNTVSKFIAAYSNGTTDLEFKVRGDGEVTSDGGFTGGGADYGEWWEAVPELAEALAGGADIRGMSVVLEGEKFRLATADDDPDLIYGVISARPSVVGDADMERWKDKYLRDDFNDYIWEDYQVVDEDGEYITQQRRKLNPEYDPDQDYIPRAERPEWQVVGLLGKLRIRKDQPTGARWIKMRDVSADVEEWFVR